MSEKAKEKTDSDLIKLNYASVILLVTVLIPVVYTVFANLEKTAPAPVITKAEISTPTVAANPVSAIETALKAVADNPGYQSYLNLGLAYYTAANYNEAIKTWNKTLEYNNRSELVYNNIAAAYGAMSKWDEEIEACKKALDINPNFDLAKNNLKWATDMKNKK